VTGFIPALSRRFLTVLRGIPSSLAISEAVNPSTFSISAYTRKILKKVVKKRRFILT
jgi:hypothetical protein